jgi:hypothetical protein
VCSSRLLRGRTIWGVRVEVDDHDSVVWERSPAVSHRSWSESAMVMSMVQVRYLVCLERAEETLTVRVPECFQTIICTTKMRIARYIYHLSI